MAKRKRNKLSPEAKEFISEKIAANREEGKPLKQSVAIAYSQARQAGYHVPVLKKSKSKLRKLS